jgi:hypothetical protein
LSTPVSKTQKVKLKLAQYPCLLFFSLESELRLTKDENVQAGGELDKLKADLKK